MTLRPSKILFWATFTASLLLFFSPVSVGGGDEFDLDKLVHAGVFAALAITASIAYPKQKFLVIVLLFTYALGSEFIQGTFLPRRHFDWYDITADILGLIIGTIFVIFLPKEKPSHQNGGTA